MSRLYSNDEILTGMANELDFISFGMDEEDIAYFDERMSNPAHEGRPINVFPYPGHRCYRVRLSLGGKTRTIGITKNGPNAARFADMAKLFFWPFRLRGIRFPCDNDFNYGLKATEDASNVYGGENEVAMRLLERIKNHLIDTGALKLRLKEGAKREDRRTVRSDVNLRFAEQERLITELSKQNTNAFEQCRQAFQHVVEKLTKQAELICALSELVITQFHIAEKQRTAIQESLHRIEKFFAPIGGMAFHQLDYTPSVDNTPDVVDDVPPHPGRPLFETKPNQND